MRPVSGIRSRGAPQRSAQIAADAPGPGAASRIPTVSAVSCVGTSQTFAGARDLGFEACRIFANAARTRSLASFSNDRNSKHVQS